MKAIWKGIIMICGLSIIVFLAGCKAGSADSTIEEITVDGMTIDEEYTVGDVNIENWEIIFQMSDDTTEKIFVDESMISNDDLEKLSEVGTHSIIVTYQDFSYSVSVTIIDPVPIFTVRFNGGLGILVSGTEVQTIDSGDDAIPPEYELDFHTFDGWNVSYEDISQDTIVTA